MKKVVIPNKEDKIANISREGLLSLSEVLEKIAEVMFILRSIVELAEGTVEKQMAQEIQNDN